MASKKEIVTESTVMAESNKAVAEGEKERKKLARLFKQQPLVSVSIPPLYKPYFGRVMTITINGTSVAIPVDGKTYKVPKVFANEAAIRMFRQNQLIEKQNRLGDVTNNFEVSPGALNLF